MAKRGGDVKKAPPGFYTAREARERLNILPSAFQTMVTKGEIERVIPPLRREGYYKIEDIDRLANQQDLFFLQNLSTKKYEKTTFEKAEANDADGIHDVLSSLWGEENATPADLRRSWYKANSNIDYVVKFRSLVLGYINATPYRPDTLEDLMSGKKRGWDIKPHEILPFDPGNSYDVFVGIAVRQDVPGHEYYAKRLIYGFFSVLNDLAQNGITIKRMFATSDQPFGIKISQDLGFERQPAQPGDKFGRFMLDMEKANTLLARKYREISQNKQKQPFTKIVKKYVTYDDQLEEKLHDILDNLKTNNVSHEEILTAYLSLINELSDSSQMTIEQQVLLKNIYFVINQILEKGA